MRNTKYYLVLFGLLLILAPSYSQVTENISFTTYYPAPVGVFIDLRSENVAVGLNYSDPNQYSWDTDGVLAASEFPQNANFVVEGKAVIGAIDHSLVQNYQLSLSAGITLDSEAAIAIEGSCIPAVAGLGTGDVDNSGTITAADVNLITNFLNVCGATQVPIVCPAATTDEQLRMDVNRDGSVSPGDVLILINYLNNPGTAFCQNSRIVFANQSNLIASVDSIFMDSSNGILSFKTAENGVLSEKTRITNKADLLIDASVIQPSPNGLDGNINANDIFVRAAGQDNDGNGLPDGEWLSQLLGGTAHFYRYENDGTLTAVPNTAMLVGKTEPGNISWSGTSFSPTNLPIVLFRASGTPQTGGAYTTSETSFTSWMGENRVSNFIVIGEEQ